MLASRRNSKVDHSGDEGVNLNKSLVAVDVGGVGKRKNNTAMKLAGSTRTKREVDIDTAANSGVGGKSYVANTAIVVDDVSLTLGALESSQLPQTPSRRISKSLGLVEALCTT